MYMWDILLKINSGMMTNRSKVLNECQQVFRSTNKFQIDNWIFNQVCKCTRWCHKIMNSSFIAILIAFRSSSYMIHRKLNQFKVELHISLKTKVAFPLELSTSNISFGYHFFNVRCHYICARRLPFKIATGRSPQDLFSDIYHALILCMCQNKLAFSGKVIRTILQIFVKSHRVGRSFSPFKYKFPTFIRPKFGHYSACRRKSTCRY